jgi:hypothetical protein
LKVKCFNLHCVFNAEEECSRSEIRVDELGMCIDARVTTQYPQEGLRRKRSGSVRRGKKGSLGAKA